MLLWFAIAALIVLALAGLLIPLVVAAPTVSDGEDVGVFAAQLDEVEADRARGLLGESEAESARTEIARRLLRADKSRRTIARPARRAWIAAIVVVLFVPAFAVPAYLFLGRPAYHDQPLAARLVPKPDDSLATLVAKAEARLAETPDDGNGWAAIAPALRRLGRFQDAAAAYRRASELLGESADRLAGEAESLVLADNGKIGPAATDLLQRAAALDPAAPGPAIFLAVAARQRGDIEDAAARWRTLLAGADGSEPWRPIAAAEIDQLRGMEGGEDLDIAVPAPPAGPDAAAVAAASNMTPEARQAMVEGMVARLATRLDSDGGAPDEWLRLVRAYRVLGDEDAARAAAEKALKTIPLDDRTAFASADGVKDLVTAPQEASQ
ncbi:c-type cytochrome biogenesis protein CcmI [Acuticoccus mangrovi]|uniref:C-type cytochrome biogenesis protein CcmI n=1 Tax=Acuticoccus mangrovi TaxID=2796142 RepID=A0A934MFB9_9HYPH|nr:c-type cytochrome biogenesis protein CcmI [Acuticoccus mangrovi]MBJ3774760.1 c-type cytochrome biogenesis protein CcmI [Acuticoccus mangrovi]